MAVEFEVKILSIDVAEIREKLAEIGHFSRSVTLDDEFFENAHVKTSGSTVRLRDVGGDCTLTFKGPYVGKTGRKEREETELSIPEMAVGRSILQMVGLSKVSQRRLEREYYTVRSTSVEIVFSSRFPPYLEVEGEHAAVIGVCELMGFKDSELTVGGEVYQRE